MSERNYWQRMRRTRMNRRSLLRASARAGVGAAGLALVGCGDDDDDSAQQQAAPAASTAAPQQQQQQDQPAAAVQQQQQQAEQQAVQADQQEDDQEETAVTTTTTTAEAAAGGPTRGGELRISTPAETHDYFDPHRGVFGPTQYWMGWYMNTLIRWRNKEQGIMEADIASLPEVPDETTYIFSVDQGARFWDQYPTEGGRDVTSEDIRVNFQRQIDSVDAAGAPDSTFLGASAFQKTSSMETPDDITFIAKTAGPDATWLGVPLRPFAWITSPEAISEFGDRWKTETTNIELSSGTGPMIPQFYDGSVGTELSKNPDYWKMGADGLPLPYYDLVTLTNFTDATAVEAAYRSNQLNMGGFPLSSEQVKAISDDFPDHPKGDIAFGFTIITGGFNYNPDWDGEDGLGNPYRDRRFCMALTTAVDRYLMIDAVYLGSGRPSGTGETPWFSAYWAIPEDELLQVPGYRPNRDEDVAQARELLDASGYDTSRELTLIAPDIWEGTYPGVIETQVGMYREALGIDVKFDVQPYTVILERWIQGTYPGQGPQWTNPPSDLDPTTSYNNNYVPGGSTNNLFYDFQPMTDIAETMITTLDTDSRRDMAREAQRILLGTHPEHGMEGLMNSTGVMNGISPNIWWPYITREPDSLQFAHASHRHDTTWIDTEHPDYA